MKKSALTFLSVFFGFLFLTVQSVKAANDADAVKKLSSFKSTGLSTGGEKIPQKSELADNIKKNILPLIKLPAGFKIELFAVAPDARALAVMRNENGVIITTRKTKV